MSALKQNYRQTNFRNITWILILGVGLLVAGCSETPFTPSSDDAAQPVPMLKLAPALGNGLVVFESGRTGNSDIYVIRDDGTGEVNLTNDPATDKGASISPDGTQVAFASNRGGHHGIYVITIDPVTLAVVNLEEVLSNTTDYSGYHATDWSIDGTHLLIESRRNSVHVVDRLDLDTKTWALLIPITANGQILDAHRPQYNADGTKIYAFRNPPYQGWQGDVYVHDADGSNPVRLTNLPGVQTWSPAEIIVDDQVCFLFTYHSSSVPGQIYAGHEGGGVTNISNNTYKEWEPRIPFGAGSSSFPEWFVINSDESGLSNVVLRTYAGDQRVQITNDGGARADWWVGAAYVAPLDANIEFHPESMNVTSKGRYVTVYLEGGESWSVGDVADQSLLFIDAISPARTPVLGDQDNDGIADLTLKFDRAEVANLLPLGDEVPVWLTGELMNGSTFRGQDIVRVFVPKKMAK